MAHESEQVCSVCSVTIKAALGGDLVVFSTGPVGSRNTLWARVCQYTSKPGCINRSPKTDSLLKSKKTESD
jgi:hypothetical protein